MQGWPSGAKGGPTRQTTIRKLAADAAALEGIGLGEMWAGGLLTQARRACGSGLGSYCVHQSAKAGRAERDLLGWRGSRTRPALSMHTRRQDRRPGTHRLIPEGRVWPNVYDQMGDVKHESK
jgi:hypothetical protein